MRLSERPEDLSVLQRETLDLLSRNHTSKEIGRHLGVTASAIDQRIETLLRNLGLSDRRELARWYRQATEQMPTEPSQLEQPLADRETSTSERHPTNSDPLPCLLEMQQSGRWRGRPLSEMRAVQRLTRPGSIRLRLDVTLFELVIVILACMLVPQYLG